MTWQLSLTGLSFWFYFLFYFEVISSCVMFDFPFPPFVGFPALFLYLPVSHKLIIPFRSYVLIVRLQLVAPDSSHYICFVLCRFSLHFVCFCSGLSPVLLFSCLPFCCFCFRILDEQLYVDIARFSFKKPTCPCVLPLFNHDTNVTQNVALKKDYIPPFSTHSTSTE